MKGITVKEFGGPETCQYVSDLPIPEPNDNQIQIRVHAAGVNPVDTVRTAPWFEGALFLSCDVVFCRYRNVLHK